jgi:hypothetical protein
MFYQHLVDTPACGSNSSVLSVAYFFRPLPSETIWHHLERISKQTERVAIRDGLLGVKGRMGTHSQKRGYTPTPSRSGVG